MDAMKPLLTDTTDHAGVFLVAENMVEEYVEHLHPQVLRYNKLAKSYGCDALNFGIAKGLQFARVLIVPTGPIKKYLETGDLIHLSTSKDKVHVAVTRARHSVAFVFNGQSPIVPARFP
jgi:DNA helicase-2/ATP-dependent DNA helicase PcrA